MLNKIKKYIRGLTLEEYIKYVKTSSSHVNSIDDLAQFGIKKSVWSKDDHERGYTTILGMNSAEEKIVKPGDWEYVINRYNFREMWDFDSPRPKIGFFGCSFTFGEGIEYKDTFVSMVSKQFDFNCFNLAIGGSSLQRVAKTFSAASKVIDLDYAVFTLPQWHRQMYLDDQGKIVNLIPQWPHQQYEELSNQLTALNEEYYIVQAVSYVNWIHDLAEHKNIKIILCSWDYPLNDLCEVMYPNETIKPFPNIDDKCARDKMHPGVLSQHAHAEQIKKAIYDRAWF